MSKMFMPYNFASEIEEHFIATGRFKPSEFISIVETLQATGSETNQRNTVTCFKKLSREEVIRRSAIVSRLDKLLHTIHSNGRHHPISRS